MKKTCIVIAFLMVCSLFFVVGAAFQRSIEKPFRFVSIMKDIDDYLGEECDDSAHERQDVIGDFQDFSLWSIENAYIMPRKYGYEYSSERLSIVIAEIAFKMFQEQLRTSADLHEIRMPLDLIVSTIAVDSQQEEMTKMFKVTILSVALRQLAPEDEWSYMNSLQNMPDGEAIITLIRLIRNERSHDLWISSISSKTSPSTQGLKTQTTQKPHGISADGAPPPVP